MRKKYLYKILAGFILWGMFSACSDSSADNTAMKGNVSVSMVTEGIYHFGEYIHSLNVYAFRQSDENEYFFYTTIAELNQDDIDALESGNTTSGSNTDGKILNINIPAGSYKFFFVANTGKRLSGDFLPGVTRPADVFLTYPPGGLNESYFLGSIPVIAGETGSQNVSITLRRIISKLIVQLYDVPEQVEMITFNVGGIASKVDMNGDLSADMIIVSKAYFLSHEDVYSTDTVNYEFLTFPAATGFSDLDIVFQSESGEQKIKTITGINLLPDKYVEITGKINPGNSGLLNFDVLIRIAVNENWGNEAGPDFPIIK